VASAKSSRFVWVIVGLFLCALAACGDDDGGGGSSGPPPNYPTCVPGMLTLQGTVNDEEVSFELEYFSYSFVNLGEGEMRVDGRTPEGEWSLELDFGQVFIGQTVPANGRLDLAAAGGPKLGNCPTGAKVSSIMSTEDGAKFILRELHEDPFCEGAAVEGTLYGCVDTREPPFACGELTCAGEQYCLETLPGAVMEGGEATSSYACVGLPDACFFPSCGCLERNEIQCDQCDRSDGLTCTVAAP